MAYDIKFKSPNEVKWYSLPSVTWIGALKLTLVQIGFRIKHAVSLASEWKIFKLNFDFMFAWNILHRTNLSSIYRICHDIILDSSWKIWKGSSDKLFGWKIVRDNGQDWISENQYAYKHPINKILTQHQAEELNKAGVLVSRIIKSNTMDRVHNVCKSRT